MRIDKTFTAYDLIRLYERNLDDEERLQVRNFFKEELKSAGSSSNTVPIARSSLRTMEYAAELWFDDDLRGDLRTTFQVMDYSFEELEDFSDSVGYEGLMSFLRDLRDFLRSIPDLPAVKTAIGAALRIHPGLRPILILLNSEHIVSQLVHVLSPLGVVLSARGHFDWMYYRFQQFDSTMYTAVDRIYGKVSDFEPNRKPVHGK